MSSSSSALTFANVSTDSELTLQPDMYRSGKECELMKLRSVGTWRAGLLFKCNHWSFANHTKEFGWRYWIRFLCKFSCVKLTNPLNTALSTCSMLLLDRPRYSRLFIFSNVPGIISLISFSSKNSRVKFVSQLNALVGKYDGKRQLGIHRRGWEHYITT